MTYYSPNQSLQYKPSKNLDQYAFSVGVIKALESKLIRPEDFRKLSDEPLTNVLTFLKGYYPSLSEEVTISNLNSFVEESRQTMHRLFGQILPEPFLINLCFLSDDFHNLKVELKRMIFQIKTEKLYRYHVGTLNQGILTNVSPKVFQNIFTRTYESFLATNNLQYSELLLDKEYLQLAFKLAKNSRSQIILSYYENYLKLKDLLTLLRGKKWEIPIGIIESGLASPVEFIKTLKELWFDKLNLSAVLKKFKITDYPYEGTDNLIELEKRIKIYLWNYLYGNRFTNELDTTTIFIYFKLWEYQINNIKALLLAKVTDLPGNKIRELGLTYYA